MNKKNLLLDFDGTITNIDEESEDFQRIYPELLFEELKIKESDYMDEFNQIKKDLKKNEKKGFILYCQDALPASADPYILTQSSGQELIKKFNFQVGDETKLLIDLFGKTVSKIQNGKIHYREGKERTQEFLEKVKLKYNSIFITNSKKEKVENYLKEMNKNYLSEIPVIGEAKKLFVDKNFYEVPVFFIPGAFSNANFFKRKVLLRRKSYYNILKDLSEKGITEENTSVVGDTYEVDLGLPDYLGYNVIQIENGYSKSHERKYLGKNFVRNYNELEKLLLE